MDWGVFAYRIPHFVPRYLLAPCSCGVWEGLCGWGLGVVGGERLADWLFFLLLLFFVSTSWSGSFMAVGIPAGVVVAGWIACFSVVVYIRLFSSCLSRGCMSSVNGELCHASRTIWCGGVTGFGVMTGDGSVA